MSGEYAEGILTGSKTMDFGGEEDDVEDVVAAK